MQLNKTLLLFISLLFSCKQETQIKSSYTTNIIEVKEPENEDLDILLKCGEFDLREGYYQIPDYGCIYSPKDENLIGNADVRLIPLIEKFNTMKVEENCSSDIDCLNEIYSQINSLSIEEIKTDFQAVIFVIDKRYLKDTPQLDQPFNPIIPYVVDSYYTKDNKWQKGESFKVENDKDLLEESNWRDNYTKSFIKILPSGEVSSTHQNYLPISEKWFGTYNKWFSYGEIGGMNAGWELNITINADNIIAKGDGYQMGFKDELVGEEVGDKIILHHKKNINGYTLGENMNPEFEIKKKGNEYFISSDWISDI